MFFFIGTKFDIGDVGEVMVKSQVDGNHYTASVYAPLMV